MESGFKSAYCAVVGCGIRLFFGDNVHRCAGHNSCFGVFDPKRPDTWSTVTLTPRMLPGEKESMGVASCEFNNEFGA